MFFNLNFSEFVTSKLEIHLPSFWYSNEMYKARKMIFDIEFCLNPLLKSDYQMIYEFETISNEEDVGITIEEKEGIQNESVSIFEGEDYKENHNSSNLKDLEKYFEEIKSLPTLEEFKKIGEMRNKKKSFGLPSKEKNYMKEKLELKEISRIESDTLESFMAIKKIGKHPNHPLS